MGVGRMVSGRECAVWDAGGGAEEDVENVSGVVEIGKPTKQLTKSGNKLYLHAQ